MTSMYIDFCLKSNKHIANLDKFFTGKIKKKEKQICIGKESVHDEYRWQLKTNKIFCIDTNDAARFDQKLERYKEIRLKQMAEIMRNSGYEETEAVKWIESNIE